MKYSVHGPYQMLRDGHIISRNRYDKLNLWERVDAEEEDLSYACGCYVFSIRNRVWYVGLAEKQSFRQECFALHKLTQYDASLNKVSGVPYLHLLAKRTPKGRFALPSKKGYKDIQALEKLLIGQAIKRNPYVMNIRDTKILRELNVPGILNSEQGQGRASAVQALKQSLGI